MADRTSTVSIPTVTASGTKIAFERLNDEPASHQLPGMIRSSISMLAVKSKSVLSTVGSGFGLADPSGTRMRMWLEQTIERAREGRVGIPLAEAFPHSNKYRLQTEALDQLQDTLDSLCGEPVIDLMSLYDDIIEPPEGATEEEVGGGDGQESMHADSDQYDDDDKHDDQGGARSTGLISAKPEDSELEKSKDSTENENIPQGNQSSEVEIGPGYYGSSFSLGSAYSEAPTQQAHSGSYIKLQEFISQSKMHVLHQTEHQLQTEGDDSSRYEDLSEIILDDVKNLFLCAEVAGPSENSLDFKTAPHIDSNHSASEMASDVSSSKITEGGEEPPKSKQDLNQLTGEMNLREDATDLQQGVLHDDSAGTSTYTSTMTRPHDDQIMSSASCSITVVTESPLTHAQDEAVTKTAADVVDLGMTRPGAEMLNINFSHNQDVPVRTKQNPRMEKRQSHSLVERTSRGSSPAIQERAFHSTICMIPDESPQARQSSVCFRPYVEVASTQDFPISSSEVQQMLSEDGVDSSGGTVLVRRRSILKSSRTSLDTVGAVDSLEECDLQKEPERDLLQEQEAMKQYYKFQKIECKKKIEELQSRRRHLEKFIDNKKDNLVGALLNAKDRHQKKSQKKVEPVQRAPAYGPKARFFTARLGLYKQDKLSPSSSTILEKELPQHTPWLTYSLIVLQMATMIYLLVSHGSGPVRLEPSLHLKRGVVTFKGLETVEHWTVPNIWIGPPAKALIESGALYAPCVRHGHGGRESGHGPVQKLGCCVLESRSVAATTYKQECHELTSGAGLWSDQLCSHLSRSQDQPWQAWLRPCCFGLNAACKLTTEEHCHFMAGQFHARGGEHCSQVDCVGKMCGRYGNEMNQWWRVPLGLLLHQGVVHLALVVLGELVLGRQTEMVAGWHRMLFIYALPGMLSLLVGCLFVPLAPHTGGSGVVCALLAVSLVDVVQSWKLLDRPLQELLKFIMVSIVIIFAGTLPFIDNYAQIGGFVYGILIGIVFLPYFTFGYWDVVHRRFLMLICLPMLLISVVVVCYAFALNLDIDKLCPSCSLFTCIPYTDLMCNITVLW